MPKVEQYDWDKLKPITLEKPHQAHLPKTFKKKKIGKRRVTKNVRKQKRPKDYHLGRAFSHLKDIMKEQF